MVSKKFPTRLITTLACAPLLFSVTSLAETRTLKVCNDHSTKLDVALHGEWYCGGDMAEPKTCRRSIGWYNVEANRCETFQIDMPALTTFEGRPAYFPSVYAYAVDSAGREWTGTKESCIRRGPAFNYHENKLYNPSTNLVLFNDHACRNRGGNWVKFIKSSFVQGAGNVVRLAPAQVSPPPTTPGTPPTPSPITTLRRLRNVASGLCLDVQNNSTASGALILQRPCAQDLGQNFKIVVGETGGRALVNERSLKCLDVPGGRKDLGLRIEQHGCHYDTNQLWEFVPHNGKYLIKSYATGMCLDIPGSSNRVNVAVEQFECHGETNQLWSLQNAN